jgi:hypothetical protein
MPDRISEVFAQIQLGIAAALERAGQQEVAAIKDDLNVPIEYGEDHPPIRSHTGEPPRRGVKTHPLQDSIQHAVVADDDSVKLVVSAGPVIGDDGEEYSVKLEQGGWSNTFKSDIRPRPYLGPSQARVEQTVGQDIAESIKTRVK